jgi:hypothetical protein
MRSVLLPIVLLVALTFIADGTPLSETDLKNLLAAIRRNRTTWLIFGNNECDATWTIALALQL